MRAVRCIDWLAASALEYIRERWDDDTPAWPSCSSAQKNATRRSKTARAGLPHLCLAALQPLTPTETLTSIPRYHSIWTDVPADDLLWIDDLACHGNFRQWAKITYHFQEAMTTPPHNNYSRDLARRVQQTRPHHPQPHLTPQAGRPTCPGGMRPGSAGAPKRSPTARPPWHCSAATSTPTERPTPWTALGYLAQRTGRHRRALDRYRQAVALLREIGNAHGEADTLVRLGEAHLALGDRRQARTTWQQALHLYEAQNRTDHGDHVRRQLTVNR